MNRLAAATRKEFLQFKRDRVLIFLILWTYTIEVILCTVALSFDVKDLRIAVYDRDRSQVSRRFVEQFTASEYFRRPVYVSNPDAINNLLDAGEADMGIIIPENFPVRLEQGRTADVEFIFGNTNPNTTNAALGYSQAIMERFSHELLSARMARAGQALTRGIEPRVRVWFNPELEFQYFMVISMIVLAGLIVGMIHPAATLVREKETGTVEQLMVTPLRRHEIVISKLLPTIAIAMFSLLPSLLIAKGFDVPIKGSIALFFAASAVFLLSGMGIGAYIATFAENLQQALLISFFVLFPLMFLSGTVVPIASMPKALQLISYASPVRYYMEITLGIFLKGVGLAVLWPKFLTLLLFGAVVCWLGLRRLRDYG